MFEATFSEIIIGSDYEAACKQALFDLATRVNIQLDQQHDTSRIRSRAAARALLEERDDFARQIYAPDVREDLVSARLEIRCNG